MAERKQCGAKTRSGGVCRAPAMENGRCRLHGGATPKGIASPAWRTGRWSRYLPTGLKGKYTKAMTDPQLLELRGDIALLDTRLGEVISKLDTGEGPALWDKFQDHLAIGLAALDNGDPEKARKELNEMRVITALGLFQIGLWRDIRDMLDERRKLVESEGKRLTAMQQTITAERAMTLIGAIAGIIKIHVTDPVMLRRISEDLSKLMNVKEREPRQIEEVVTVDAEPEEPVGIPPVEPIQ